nr:MAG TPA: hypothetical protein [Caudoviricetes sp.]
MPPKALTIFMILCEIVSNNITTLMLIQLYLM